MTRNENKYYGFLFRLSKLQPLTFDGITHFRHVLISRPHGAPVGQSKALSSIGSFYPPFVGIEISPKFFNASSCLPRSWPLVIDALICPRIRAQVLIANLLTTFSHNCGSKIMEYAHNNSHMFTTTRNPIEAIAHKCKQHHSEETLHTIASMDFPNPSHEWIPTLTSHSTSTFEIGMIDTNL